MLLCWDELLSPFEFSSFLIPFFASMGWRFQTGKSSSLPLSLAMPTVINNNNDNNNNNNNM